MVNIYLDTNILHRDPNRVKREFVILNRLAEMKVVKIHLSRVTVEEFLSKRIEKLTEPLDQSLSNLTKSINDIERLVHLIELENVGSHVSPLTQQIVHLERLKDKVTRKVRDDFNGWLKSVRAIVHEIEDHHGKQVMMDYFLGNAPFRSRKSRDDIPDSFIWQSVKSLLEKSSNVHFVSCDSLFTQLGGFDTRVTCHSSLSSLFEIPECKSALISESLDYILAEYFIPIIEYIQNKSDLYIIAVSDEASEIFDSQEFHMYFFEEFSNQLITKIGSPSAISLRILEAEVFTDNSISIPFDLNVDVTTAFGIPAEKLADIDDSILPGLQIRGRKSAEILVEQSRTVKVSAALTLVFSLEEVVMPTEYDEFEISNDELRQMIDTAAINFEPISEIEALVPLAVLTL